MPEAFATHMHAVYAKTWAALGDHPSMDLSPSRKLEVRLLYGSLMVNKALILWLYCKADAYFGAVIHWISWVGQLMPYDHEIMCNVAKLHLVLAQRKHDAGDAQDAWDFFKRGRSIYEGVLQKVPDHNVALAGMEAVAHVERGLSRQG